MLTIFHEKCLSFFLGQHNLQAPVCIRTLKKYHVRTLNILCCSPCLSSMDKGNTDRPSMHLKYDYVGQIVGRWSLTEDED